MEGIPGFLLAAYKKMWVERELMGELSNRKEAALGDFEDSVPLQMTTGAQIRTAQSTEKSEGMTVQPLAKTPKIKRSDYSAQETLRGYASQILSVKLEEFWKVQAQGPPASPSC